MADNMFEDSFAQKLTRSTPTESELQQRSLNQHQNELEDKANKVVNAFKSACEHYSNNGARSCWCYASSSFNIGKHWESWTYWMPTKQNMPKNISGGIYSCGWGFEARNVIEPKDETLFLSILNRKISALGFIQFKVETEELKEVLDTYALFKHKVTIAKVFKISACW